MPFFNLLKLMRRASATRFCDALLRRASATRLIPLVFFLFFCLPSCQKEKLSNNIPNVNTVQSPTDRNGNVLDPVVLSSTLYQTYTDYFNMPNKKLVSFNWFYNKAFPSGSTSFQEIEMKQKMQGWMKYYNQVGFVTFVDFMTQSNTIVQSQADFLNDTWAILQPKFSAGASFSEIETILLDKRSKILSSTDFTDIQKNALLIFVETTRTHLKYLNEHGIPQSPIQGSSDDRGGFCGEGALGAGASGVGGGLVGIGAYSWALSSGSVGLIAGAAALSVPIVGAVFAIVSIVAYCWGDDISCWLFGCPPGALNCTLPSNHHVTVNGCNDFKISLLGTGSDINSFTWHIINGTPITSTTSIAALNNVKSISPILPVKFTVDLRCSDGSIATTAEKLFFPATVSNAAIPSATFADGPNNVAVGSQGTYYLNVGSTSGNLVVTFSADGGGVIAQGPNWATIQWYSTGNKSVKATVTNICNGASATATYPVKVN
jgi:hypothetical protein